MARVRTLRILRAATACSLMALVIVDAPAHAADATVTVRAAPPGPAGAYDPREVAIEHGDMVTWVFTDANFHTVSDRTGLDLFESGSRRAGAFAVTFEAAGTYGYYCQLHPADMRGKVEVLMRSVEAKGGYVLHWATRDARAGYVYDVRLREPGEKKYTMWRRGIDREKARFEPGGRGNYKFRARLRHVASGESAGYSPVLLIEHRPG